MAIDILDHIGQKVTKEKQANFVIEPTDTVIQAKFLQPIDFDEQPIIVRGVFFNTAYKYLLRWYEISSTANSLKVIWQREEDVTAVSHEPSEEELLDSWDRYFEEHWDELVARYKSKYVAIWKETVYDSDEDLVALATRVYKDLGYRPIFMPYIGEQRRVAEFLSPV